MRDGGEFGWDGGVSPPALYEKRKARYALQVQPAVRATTPKSLHPQTSIKPSENPIEDEQGNLWGVGLAFFTEVGG